LVPLGIIEKVIGGDTYATNYGCVNAAIVKTDVGVVTPITIEIGMGVVTHIVVNTLVPLTINCLFDIFNNSSAF
jgi:hypothetical protein